MARARIIHPEMFTSDDFMSLSIPARLLWVGLIVQADDNGRGRASVRALQGAVFPGDPEAANVGDWLAEITSRGMARLYQVGGTAYYSIPSWDRWQVIKYRRKTSCPPPEEAETEAEPGPLFSDSRQNFPEPEKSGPERESREREDTTYKLEPSGKGNGTPPASAGAPPAPAGRGSQEKKTRVSAKDVETVFAFWKKDTNHADAKLLPKRRRLIEDRLREGYSVEDLCTAIRGCSSSPFHMGENDRRTRYDDLTLICRDGTKVESFIQRFEETRKGVSR